MQLMIGVMPWKLTDKCRFASGRTAPPLQRRFRKLWDACQDSGMQFQKQTVSREALLSAIVLSYLEDTEHLPEREQVDLVRPFVAKFERIMEETNAAGLSIDRPVEEQSVEPAETKKTDERSSKRKQK